MALGDCSLLFGSERVDLPAGGKGRRRIRQDLLQACGAGAARPRGADFAKLRESYASSKFYRRYEFDPAKILAAKVLGRAEPSQASIRQYVRDNFALPGAHLIAIGKLGLKVGTPEFEMHKVVHVKLLEAIVSTGKGLSK